MGKRRYLHSPKFHLTPIDNITSVRKYGLRADADARGKGRVWLCDLDMIEPVACHLLDVKKVSYQVFALYSVRWWLLREHLRKHSVAGIYWVPCDVPHMFMSFEKRYTADKFSGGDVVSVG
jgi:hypothetical protein